MTKIKNSKISNSYEVGDRVFAKLKGYPWWPARIETVENQSKPLKYKILFYATYEINLIKPDCLVPFNDENIEKYGERRKYKYFNEAMDEIQNDPDLKNLTKRNEFDNDSESDSKNDHNSNSSTKNSENTSLNEFDESEKIDVERQSSERSKSDLESKTDSEKSFKKNENIKKKLKKYTQSNTLKKSANVKHYGTKLVKKVKKKDLEKKNVSMDEKNDGFSSGTNKTSNSNSENESSPEIGKKNSKRSIDDDDDDNDDNKDFDSKTVSRKTRKIISDEDEIMEKTFHIKEKENSSETKKVKEIKDKRLSKENSDLKKSRNKLNLEKNDPKNKNKTEESPKDKPEKKDIEQIFAEKKVKIDSKIKLSKMSTDEKETLKKKLKEKKIYEKKLAKLRSIKVQMALLRMSVEIKKCLREDNLDEKKCCLLMQDMLKLPFSQKNLFKTPEVVETIRESKNFKKSEKIKKMAVKCYSKFISLFSLNSEEQFLSIFEKERVKFLTENEHEIKKEKLISQKLLSSRVKSNKTQSNTESNNKLIKNEPTKKDNFCGDEQNSKQEKKFKESLSPRNTEGLYDLEKQEYQNSESSNDIIKNNFDEKMDIDN